MLVLNKHIRKSLAEAAGPIRFLIVLSFAIAFVLGAVASNGSSSTKLTSDAFIPVRTVEELVAALEPRNAGRHIRLHSGEYAVDHPLTVPDGTVLEGTGVMQVENGLPLGFEPGTATTIRVTSGFAGDVITLGNGSVLSALRLEDLKTEPGSAPQRSGNVIVVGSRAAHDVVSAEIRDCEVTNPNPMGVALDGPIGHDLVVLTRNLARQDDPPPHEGAAITVRMERSILRANGGGGAVFIINFAAHGKVSVVLDGNVLEGALNVAGGTSRPDLVTGAEAVFESRNNLYALRPGGYDAIAWRVYGGSSSHVPGLASPGSSFNVAHIISDHDRIIGFKVGIRATGGRRWQSASGPLKDNRLELELRGTQIQTEGEGAADLVLQGAMSDLEFDDNREFPAGDRNVLRVLMHGVTGSSAPRANTYADVFGPELESNRGSGNRLEFAGSLAGFEQSNTGITPAPPAEFFLDQP